MADMFSSLDQREHFACFNDAPTSGVRHDFHQMNAAAGMKFSDRSQNRR
jgi:hypothetical protein